MSGKPNKADSVEDKKGKKQKNKTKEGPWHEIIVRFQLIQKVSYTKFCGRILYRNKLRGLRKFVYF